MMQREGEYIKVLEMFYRTEFQAVLLFGLKSWVLLAAMDKRVKGAHTGLLRQILGKREWRNTDGTWVTPAAGEVHEAAGMQSMATYIGRRKGKVAQLVALRPIFKFCAIEKGYEGTGDQEGPMVETRGTRRDSQGNLGGYVRGGQDKVDREVPPVGGGSGDNGGRWVVGWRCGDGDGQCPGGRRNPCSDCGRHIRLV